MRERRNETKEGRRDGARTLWQEKEVLGKDKR